MICVILRACTLSGKPGASVSHWELFCQLLLIFLYSLQLLWLANLHEREKKLLQLHEENTTKKLNRITLGGV